MRRTASPVPVPERIAPSVMEVGAFSVHRTLPSRQRQLVGPWCFCDHLGPATFRAGEGMRVGPHPHIGLQAFTWMIEGSLIHTDSLGQEIRIRPGQINLLTAGAGVAHAEESPPGEAGRLHAVQMWIALPEGDRNREPDFSHHEDLPLGDRDGFRWTLLAGQGGGAVAPTRHYSPLVAMDLAGEAGACTRLALDPDFEHALLLLEGEAEGAGGTLEPETLLYLGRGRSSLDLECRRSSRILLIGGAPFGEETLLWWNFVARCPEEMSEAADDWNRKRRFGPLPASRLSPLPAPDPRGLRLKSGRG